MPSLSSLFAYVGPDAYLPVASVVSAVSGIVLLFWRAGVGFCRERWGNRTLGVQARDVPRLRRQIAVSIEPNHEVVADRDSRAA